MRDAGCPVLRRVARGLGEDATDRDGARRHDNPGGPLRAARVRALDAHKEGTGNCATLRRWRWDGTGGSSDTQERNSELSGLGRFVREFYTSRAESQGTIGVAEGSGRGKYHRMWKTGNAWNMSSEGMAFPFARHSDVAFFPGRRPHTLGEMLRYDRPPHRMEREGELAGE